MDKVTLAAAVAVAKTIPDTALGDCTAAKVAAEAAQAAAEAAQEAAESAAAGVEYPVSYAEQTLTDAQRTQARANIAAADANVLDALGFVRFWDDDAEQTATYSSLTFTWQPPFLTIDGTAPSSITAVRLCGDILAKKQSSISASDTAAAFAFENGHSYKSICKLISGSFTGTSCPYIRLYSEGTTTAQSLYFTRNQVDVDDRQFDSTGSASVWLAINKSIRFDNAKFIVTIQDITNGALLLPPFTEGTMPDGLYKLRLQVVNGHAVWAWAADE